MFLLAMKRSYLLKWEITPDVNNSLWPLNVVQELRNYLPDAII